jgi:hypothetical protein
MDVQVAWRAALIMAVSVALVAVVLALALPRSFFESFGWAAGPGAWALCALLVARALRLPAVPVLAGAAVAGVPGLLGVVLDAHWLGPPFGVVLFGLWCGRLATGGGRAAVAA